MGSTPSFPAPETISPLDEEALIQELQSMRARIRSLEQGGPPRGLQLSPDGLLVVPGFRLPGTGQGGSGAPPIVMGDKPGDPTGVTVTSGADEDSAYLDVSWSYPALTQLAVAGFQVRWSKENETDWRDVRTTGDSIRIDNVVGGLDYYVQVRTESTIGVFSDWVNAGTYPITAAADATSPDPPTGLVMASAYRAVQLSWNEPDDRDLAGYEVQIATASSFSIATIVHEGTVTASLFTVTDLPPLDTGSAETYWARVRSRDFSGNTSAYTTAVSSTQELIESAHIVELTADKIKAGTIGTEVLTLSNSSNSRIQSFDGTSMVIRGNGTAAFSQVTITGGSLNINGNAVIDSSGNATFSGTMTATNATVTGTLRTGTSGNYMTIAANSNDMLFFASGAREGRIFYGNSRMSYTGDDNTTGLFLTNNAAVTAQNGTAFLGVLTDGISSIAPTVAVGPFPGGATSASVNNAVNIVAGYQTFGSAPGRVQVSANELALIAGKSGTKIYVWDGSVFQQSATFTSSGGFTDFNFGVEPLPTLSGNTMTYNTTSEQVGYTTSSINAKRDVVDLTGATEILRQLRPVSFRWKDDLLERSKRPTDQPAEPGLIAEEVEAVKPEWVNHRGDEVTGIRQEPLLGLVMGVLHEMDARLSALEQ